MNINKLNNIALNEEKKNGYLSPGKIKRGKKNMNENDDYLTEGSFASYGIS